MTAPEFQSWREGDMWVIDVPGYGITQAETEADCARMAADLVEQTRAAKVAEFEGADAADESLRERVARALSDAVAGNSDYDGPIADLYRQLADAAICVLRGESC